MTPTSTTTFAEKIAAFLRLLKHHRSEPAGSYDAVADVYDLFAAVWDRVVAGAAIAEYERLLAERVTPGAKVLDAGAGTGERTLAILRQGEPGSIVALDASQRMLDVAMSKLDDPRVSYVLGDITELPFADDTFDVVSCTWVIEILDDPGRAVGEFLRVLKPGGTVLYAFCSLPSGPIGSIARWLATLAPQSNPATHLLPEAEQPFHRCEMSSLQRFSGGLTTVVTLGKCCSPWDPSLPCTLDLRMD